MTTTTRAADDFATIRARLEELRRERLQRALESEERSEPLHRRDGKASDPERRQKDKSEGVPPPWAPTIFVKKRAV